MPTWKHASIRGFRSIFQIPDYIAILYVLISRLWVADVCFNHRSEELKAENARKKTPLFVVSTFPCVIEIWNNHNLVFFFELLILFTCYAGEQNFKDDLN